MSAFAAPAASGGAEGGSCVVTQRPYGPGGGRCRGPSSHTRVQRDHRVRQAPTRRSPFGISLGSNLPARPRPAHSPDAHRVRPRAPLENLLEQPGQQPALPGQLHPIVPRPGLREKRRDRGPLSFYRLGLRDSRIATCGSCLRTRRSTSAQPRRGDESVGARVYLSSGTTTSSGSTGMGLIHIELFATLDLVAQAPGGPDEDPAGFPFGGWQAPLLDEVTGTQVGAAYEGTDALLLGRRTYDIFAAYWPNQDGGEDNEIATLFNSVPKYVASRGRPDLSWAGSTQLGPDLAGAVHEIRDRHRHVKVVGSLNLVQTLLREKLFDRLDLWVHPVILGVGKKVFDGGAVPTNVTLLEPPAASPRGTVYLRYGLADGTPGTGDMSAPDRGVGRDG